MTVKVTLTQLLAMDPCNPEGRAAQFGKRKTMNAAQAIAAGVSIDDILWVAQRLGRKDLCVRFALACAQRTAHLNADPRIQAALDAAAKWIADPSEENRNAAANAAYAAANAAANAANAAYAAANAAANAAYAAANAAANAAYAAANAAANAAYAAANAANAAYAAANAAANAAYAANAAARAKEIEAQKALIIEIFGGN